MKIRILVLLLIINTDISAQNNGTLLNGASFTSDVPRQTGMLQSGVSWSSDVPSVLANNHYSVTFNGSSSYINNWGTVLSSNSAMSCWFKVSAFGGWLFGLSVNANTRIQVLDNTHIVIEDDGGIAYSFVVPVMTADTWYNLIIKHENPGVRVYLNNVESGSGIQTSIVNNISLNLMGKDPYNSYAFNGKIADVRFWSGIITSTDRANMYSGLDPVTPPSLYMKLNEGTGTTVYDIIGAPLKYSVVLDGIDDNIQFTNPLSFGTTWSMSFWVKPGAANFSLFVNTNGDKYLNIVSGGDSHIYLNLGTSGTLLSPVPINNSAWYNIIITNNAGTYSVYVDDVQGTTLSQPTGTATFNSMGGNSSLTFGNGELSDFIFWDGAVITSTDRSNINSGAAPSTTPSLHWKMNEGSGTIVHDYQSGGNSNGGGGSNTANQWTTSGTNIYNSNSGSVGIGTSQINDVSYKLFVENGIRTRKIKVDQSSWPDYVFDKKYKLPSLDEIEKYTNINKHLPGIPSAQQVVKNGIDLGSNQALLLKKIEEITILLIAEDRKVKRLEKILRANNFQKKIK